MFELRTPFTDSGFVGVRGEMEVGRGTMVPKREAAEVEDLKLVLLAGTVVEMAGKGRAKWAVCSWPVVTAGKGTGKVVKEERKGMAEEEATVEGMAMAGVVAEEGMMGREVEAEKAMAAMLGKGSQMGEEMGGRTLMS